MAWQACLGAEQTAPRWWNSPGTSLAHVDPVLFYFSPEGVAGDAELGGGEVAVAVVAGEDGADGVGFGVFEGAGAAA